MKNLIGKTVYQTKTIEGSDILMRYPNIEDVGILRNYINILSKEQTFISFQGEQVTVGEEKKYLDEKIKKIKKNQAVMLLVFINKKLAAVSDITMFERTSSHVGLLAISVGKEFRNQGIGRLLMKLVLSEAENRIKDLKIVTLAVFADNPVAQKMYAKFGFIKYGQLPEGIKHKDIFVDEIYMYKKIV